ncbi:MAG: adenylosuccinate synthetase [Lachnospiraceae bacterium]|nr:adenylosuccinate synthetase [Lachnospiraceae bacterium]
MSDRKVIAIIGKGFGDEGKGLATDYFCSQVPDTLVIKHNGGAQAGHTVEPEGKRFVFHQLSAGSFCGADTFWADSYYPDLYKLGEEMEEFRRVSGICPGIFSDERTNVTLIDDILINMILELSRGGDRHGSCGMGINECDLRTGAGFKISVKDILGKDEDTLVKDALRIRKEYQKKRLEDAGIPAGTVNIPEASEMYEMLSSEDVLINFIDGMKRNAEKYVDLCEDTGKLIRSREQVIFETGQGLLLDSENAEYAPHVTASRTGLYNPCRILSEYGLGLTEAVYVTRSYVTRHGAGPLLYECDKEELGIKTCDETNVHNEWQGSIRYARHGSVDEFLAPVYEDLKNIPVADDGGKTVVSLFITHLNETGDRILMKDRDMTVADLMGSGDVNRLFDRFYLSRSKRGCDN